jgi:hypothetical protein
MTLFQWIFGTLCAAIALRYFVRMAWGDGSRLAAIFWGLLWAGAAITIFRPGITAEVAAWMGIGRGTDLVMYLGLLAGIGVTRYFYSRHRRLEIYLTALVREFAIEHSQLRNSPEMP